MREVVRDSALIRPEGLPLTWFLVVGGLVGLPLLVLLPDYSYRYGLQWLGFYFACAGCSALVFAQSELRRDYLRFLALRFPSEAVAILLLMIVGSVCANGFMSQATGVLTMLMVLGVWPLLSFLWFLQRGLHDHVYLLVRIVVGVLVAESLFLSCYQWLGLGMSSADSLSVWPRIFLNVRDNNQWLACGFWIPLGLWFSASRSGYLQSLFPAIRRWNVLCFSALFWYLDFLTYGRGAFLAMSVVVLFVALWTLWVFGWRMVWEFLFDQLLAFGMAILSVVLLRSSTPFSQMMDRVAVDLNPSDSARWQILFQWIDSWLNASFFWGQGWGVIPSGHWPLGVWSKDPHNIYMQIAADGGIWGVLCFSLAFLFLSRCRIERGQGWCIAAFSPGLIVYQAVDRIWSISSGLWLILVSIGLCFGAARQCKATLVRRSFLGVEAIRVSSFVYTLSLSLPFLAIYSAFWLDGRA